MSRIEVPVLIVGGGGAGLTASMLLSQLGVDSLVVCADSETGDSEGEEYRVAQGWH